MRLTTKGRYAVTAMMDLALHTSGNGPIGGATRTSASPDVATRLPEKVTLADIARNQDISLSYLEQLFAKLRKQGLVKGVRGPGGGYRLARDANTITIAEIVTAVDERVDVTQCGGKEDCQAGERCLSHDLWTELSQRVYDFLDGITLGELASRPGVCEVAARQEQRQLVTPPGVSTLQ